MSRGKRKSSWLVIRRCLSIIRRVQRSPATKDELIKAVRDAEPESYRKSNDKQLNKLFSEDLNRIRNSLFINIRADDSSNEYRYSIQDIDRPLLDLPDDDLATIAFLEQNFTPNSPKYKEIRAFLVRLQFYLAPSRRKVIAKQRQALVMDLGQRDDDRLDPDVEIGLSRALERRKRVEIAYLSPHYSDGQPRRHVVDFYGYTYFENGHYYVDGWCHYIVSSTERKTVNNYRTYRLGRISEVKLLPNKLPPSPPIPKRYDVIYKLSLDIIGSGVTRKRWIDIDIEKIEYQADGVLVHGTTTKPFFAIQDLMHYQHKCELLGGTEMLSRMQETVQKMAELYKLGSFTP